MADILPREQVVHRLHPAVGRIFGAASQPQNLQLLIQYGRVRLVPFRAVPAAAERRDIRKLVQMMEPDG